MDMGKAKAKGIEMDMEMGMGNRWGAGHARTWLRLSTSD
jgi:hypothetical protein